MANEKILEVKNHPESQKLHILKVDVGTEVLQIVCGAPNVREGMVTCVATVASTVIALLSFLKKKDKE